MYPSSTARYDTISLQSVVGGQEQMLTDRGSINLKPTATVMGDSTQQWVIYVATYIVHNYVLHN